MSTESSTHTAGPWEIKNDCGTPFVYGPGSEIQKFRNADGNEMQARTKLIALVYSCGNSNDQKANTRLIAAAPELLEACEDALESSVNWRIYPDSPCLPKEVRDRLRAAIEKAKGWGP